MNVYVYILPTGEPAYVGCTRNLDARICQHRSGHKESDLKMMRECEIWYTEIDDDVTAYNVEANLIRKFRPAINIDAGHYKSNIKLKEIQGYHWERWQQKPLHRSEEELTLMNQTAGRIILEFRKECTRRTPCKFCKADHCIGCSIGKGFNVERCRLTYCFCNDGTGCLLQLENSCKACRAWKADEADA